MTKFATSVLLLVKNEDVDTLMNVAEEIPNIGQIHNLFTKTIDHKFISTTIIENEKALIDARLKMIEKLDKLRKYLEEISPELGVTDPVSGPIFCETQSLYLITGLDLLARQQTLI